MFWGARQEEAELELKEEGGEERVVRRGRLERQRQRTMEVDEKGDVR